MTNPKPKIHPEVQWFLFRESLGTILGLKLRAWLILRGWIKGPLVL